MGEREVEIRTGNIRVTLPVGATWCALVSIQALDLTFTLLIQ